MDILESSVAYALVRNVMLGNLLPMYVALKPKRHPIVEKYATIQVADEIQKPDIDLLVYGQNPKSPIVIYSCKTSLRERAGQTYRWKLLLDLASCTCPYIERSQECPIHRYEISYEKLRPVKVGFITADFYREINNPQQQGMWGFFDYVYLAARDQVSGRVKYLSSIIDDLNTLYHAYV